MLKSTALLFSCLFVTSCSTSLITKQDEVASLPVLQGATDETSTQLNIVAPVGKDYSISISFDQSLLETPQVQKKTHPSSAFQVLQVFIKNLTPDLTYTLRIYDGKTLVDERFFRTLPKAWTQARIFIISCTDDSFYELQKKQWKQISEQKPDLLFLIGDNVYVDGGISRLTTVSENDIWRRYVESTQNLDLYKFKQLIPVFATWDDHDYGINDGNSNFEHKLFAKSVFKTFFPMQDTANLTTGPGVATSLNIGQQQFLFLDDRSFRSPLAAKPQTHFGEEQTAWILQKIKSHQGPTWLISGDQFFGAYHTFESFEGHHPEDFKKFMKSLRQIKKTIVFLSGDRHLSEFSKIEKSLLGLETFEITSSGLHAKMYEGSAARHPNSRRVFSMDGVSNYLDLKVDLVERNSIKFDAEVWGENFASFLRQSFNIAPQPKLTP